MSQWSKNRIQTLLNTLNNPSYLEVGVQSGKTFREIAAIRKVAVDPSFHPNAKQDIKANDIFLEMTSDAFFASNSDKFSLIFLDGLHTSEQTYRDFCNSTDALEERGFILIDDVWPQFELGAFAKRPERHEISDRRWWGDVYKVPFIIKKFHSSWSFAYLTSGNGQLLVWRSKEYILRNLTTTQDNYSTLSLEDLFNLDFNTFKRLVHGFPIFEDIDELMTLLTTL